MFKKIKEWNLKRKLMNEINCLTPDLSKIKNMIENGVNIKTKKLSLLIIAVKKNHVSVIEFLLKNETNDNLQANDFFYLIKITLKNKNFNLTKLFVDKFFNNNKILKNKRKRIAYIKKILIAEITDAIYKNYQEDLQKNFSLENSYTQKLHLVLNECNLRANLRTLKKRKEIIKSKVTNKLLLEKIRKSFKNWFLKLFTLQLYKSNLEKQYLSKIKDLEIKENNLKIKYSFKPSNLENIKEETEQESFELEETLLVPTSAPASCSLVLQNWNQNENNKLLNVSY